MNEEQIRQIVQDEITKFLGDTRLIPIEVENALKSRGFLKGIVTGIIKATIGQDVSAISPLAGNSTVYVATSSGGAVTTAITFQDGIRTS